MYHVYDGKKGAGCVEYQHINDYVSRQPFLPHLVCYVPVILVEAPRYQCYRPELKKSTS